MKKLSSTILTAFMLLSIMTPSLSAQTLSSSDNTSQPSAAVQPKTELSATQENAVQKPKAQSDEKNDTAVAVPQMRPLKPSPMEIGEPETEGSLLVSAEWLKKNKGNVILVDARPESLYAGGHITNAVNASWTYFANMNAATGTTKWGTIWKPATMSKRIGALGINGKKMVVVYDDAGGWGQSGWVLWILRMSGIKNAKILEGGLTAWKNEGGSVSRKVHRNKAVAFSISKYKEHYLVDTDWINNNIGKNGLVLLDVRTLAEYQGKIRPFQEKRAGHLPDAVNIEMQNFVQDQYHFKEAEEIVALLQKYSITPESEIVVYDTAGVRAAFVTMALRYAGFHKSQCYDEGFQAWAGNPDLPLVKAQ
ncbi:MAG: rhodanese-like domain-containing protein [Synergistaceae bacterium]|nr:rhodanese-like domain-containing protein [Synergistaceae bacterium]